MRKYLRYALLTLLWGAVAAYVVYAGTAAGRLRAGKKVGRVEIEVVDSSSMGYLVSGRMVREWIAHSGIKTNGMAVDAVELAAIEALIAKNGFVERVDAYVTYGGVLHIDISQRRPLLRLLTDGVDSYVTPEGYVFAAPRASSLYVPVVTGAYRPPFPASFVGSVRGHIDLERAKIDKRIAELEREKYPFFRRELQNDRNISALRRMRIKKQWWRMESSAAFDARVEELRARKAELRRKYRYEARLVQEGIDRIAQRQEAERLKQKKLEKSYEDFMKLLTFVEFIEDDDFWRSEVVQIAAHTTPSGALEVELVPYHRLRTYRAGGAQIRQIAVFLPQRSYEHRLGRVPDNRYQIQRSGGLQEIKGLYRGKKELYRCRRSGFVERRGGCRREERRRAARCGVRRVETRRGGQCGQD